MHARPPRGARRRPARRARSRVIDAGLEPVAPGVHRRERVVESCRRARPRPAGRTPPRRHHLLPRPRRPSSTVGRASPGVATRAPASDPRRAGARPPRSTRDPIAPRGGARRARTTCVVSCHGSPSDEPCARRDERGEVRLVRPPGARRRAAPRCTPARVGEPADERAAAPRGPGRRPGARSPPHCHRARARRASARRSALSAPADACRSR